MKFTPLVTAALFCLSLSAQAQTTAPAPVASPPAPAPPAVVLPPQKADVPAQKFGPDGEVNPGFLAAHERFLKIAREGEAQLVFLGDSITAGWGGGDRVQIWEKAFGAYKPANFGIGGDRTQHVLWRITNGELDGIKPKAVVIMIGTNNVNRDSAEDISKGITAIVETVRSKQPQAKILLLGIFPRGEKPTGKLGVAQETIKEVNRTIAKLNDDEHVFFLDIGSSFPQPDGALTEDIMPDFLHLSPKGYQIWADAIGPKLAELMK